MTENRFKFLNLATVVPNGVAALINTPFRIQLDASASSYEPANTWMRRDHGWSRKAMDYPFINIR
jgi:hypothetical protein